jgi:hypothetical protein
MHAGEWQDTPSDAHAPFGLVPSMTFAHVPFAPPVFAAVQAWHAPPHATSQQTPSTQNVDWHSLPEVHDEPFASGALHCPITQTNPGPQSELVAHELVHDPAAQAYGVQSTPFGDTTQAPKPLQI